MKFTSDSFNMLGTEKVFEEMLNRAIKERTTPDFQHQEIGIAKGATLLSVADHLAEIQSRWLAVGFDLRDGPFFNATDFLKRSSNYDVSIITDKERQSIDVFVSNANSEISPIATIN